MHNELFLFVAFAPRTFLVFFTVAIFFLAWLVFLRVLFRFFAQYRITFSCSFAVYAHMLCRWINRNGEVVSGGAGLVSVSLRKNNDIFEYENYKSYTKPDEPDIPQSVRDALSNDSYFAEMQSEVDHDIAEYLKSNQ